MAEFQINGIQYKSGKVNAMTQLHVSRRLAPLLASLTTLAQDGELDTSRLFPVLMTDISKLSDADCEYVLHACMRVTERDQSGGRGFAPILAGDGKTIMFPDIDMIGMLTIASNVLQDNLSGFFPLSALASAGVGTAPPSNG